MRSGSWSSGTRRGCGSACAVVRRTRTWVWTYFLTQRTVGSVWHMGTLPGNPFIWVLYLLVLCALGVVMAVRHDPESDRPTLTKVALGLTALAVVLAILTMMVGYTHGVISPGVCEFC